MKLEKTHTLALRVAHIALGCLWVSGLIGMLVSMIFPFDAPTEEKLTIFHAIDEWLVIPCAVAAVITGLVLVRIKSEYPLNRSSWIFKKLIICCSVMLGGYFFVKTPLLLDFLSMVLGSFSISVEAHLLFLVLTVLAIVLLLLVFHLSIAKPTKEQSVIDRSRRHEGRIITMKKLSAQKMRGLKIVHIIGAGLWTGGITCMLVTLLSATQQSSPDAVLSQLTMVGTFDYFVVIPGVGICIALGLIYGFFSHWGFVSHKWVLLKWVLFFVACVPAATFFLPLLEEMKDLVGHVGLEALGMETFRTNHLVLIVMISAQLVLSVAMIGISVYKPFKKKRAAAQQRSREKPEKTAGRAHQTSQKTSLDVSKS